MKIGLCSANVGVCADPDVLARVARQAEESGYDSLWVSEHHVVPDPKLPSVMDPSFPLLDPVVSLSYVASITTRLLLGTGVIVLPLRNPLVLAKQLASLDVLSRGRVIFGLGVGYVTQEFAALNVPFEHRGARTDEYLEAMRSIWADERPAFAGQFYTFDGVRARPRPVQRPTPQIVVGGASEAAMRRAVRNAHGWFGWGYSLDEAEAAIARLQAMESTEARATGLGPLEVSVSPPAPISEGEAESYAAVGVDRLNLILPTGRSAAEIEEFIEAGAALITSGAVPADVALRPEGDEVN